MGGNMLVTEWRPGAGYAVAMRWLGGSWAVAGR